MNFTLRFDSKHRVLLVTLGKVVTEAIVREIHSVVVRFVDAQGPCSLIGDFTAVESSELSAQSMRSLAEMIPAIPDTPGSLRVFIAPRAAIYGLIRMFQILQGQKGPDIHVVHSTQEAYELLGLKSPEFGDVSIEPHHIRVHASTAKILSAES